MTDNLGWIDLGLLAFLVLSIVFGLVRGLVFEVLSLLGWVAAYFAAQWFAPSVAPFIDIGDPGSGLNHGLTFALVFFATLLAWSLAARLVRAMVHATPLSPVDRLLGAGFGLVRGVAVLLALASVVGLTPLRETTAWQQSEAAVWLNAALQGLKPLLPASLSQRLPA